MYPHNKAEKKNKGDLFIGITFHIMFLRVLLTFVNDTPFFLAIPVEGFFNCKRFGGVCNAKRGKAMIYARVIRDPATSNNIWPWREGSENFSYLERRRKKKEKTIFTKCVVKHSVLKLSQESLTLGFFQKWNQNK